MLLSIIKIFPSPGREHNVIEVLDSMKGPMAALADCLGCSVSVELGEASTICYMEWWRTREGFDKHLCSTLFCRVLEAMELSRKSPEIDFYEVYGIGGLSVMEKLRDSTMKTSSKTAAPRNTRKGLRPTSLKSGGI